LAQDGLNPATQPPKAKVCFSKRLEPPQTLAQILKPWDVLGVIELGPKARLVFAALYVAAQATLIGTAGHRPDGAFGFRMFPESSTLNAQLFRSTDTQAKIPVVQGEWTALDSMGTPKRIRWSDRVKRPELRIFGETISAAYGADAQVARFRAALADVAAHTPEDSETRTLSLELTLRKNGGAPYVVTLTAPRGRP